MKMFRLLNEQTSLGAAYEAATEYLEKCGVPDSSTDAYLLLERVIKCTRSEYFMRRDDSMKPADAEMFSNLVSQRGERIPLQHILGETCFYGRYFQVNENVLIPRPETEILVEETLKLIKPNMSILDMCTGSGCIAVTLAKETDANVAAADISEAALEIAKKNALVYSAKCDFIKSDMFKNISSCYDVLVSNPPYIRSADIPYLQEEVKNHDPLLALDGGDDGLGFYRIIARDGAKHIKNGGHILLEIGSDQSADVSCILNNAGFSDICVIKDLNNLPRVIKAVYP